MLRDGVLARWMARAVAWVTRRRGRLPSDSSCIFCGTIGAPSSEEHILPEGLVGDVEFTATGTGPTTSAKLVLPPGVVCRNCNNNELSQLDQHLQEALGFFKPFWNAKGTKKGKPAKTVRPGMVVQRTAKGPHIVLNNEKYPIVAEDGQVVAPFRGRQTDPRMVGWKVDGNNVSFNLQYPFVATRKMIRALYKIGFELLAYQKGPDYVRVAEFDAIRQFVLRGKGTRFIAVQTGSQPSELLMRPHLSIAYLPEPGMWFATLQLGAVIYLDLSHNGIMIRPERRPNFLEEGFVMYPNEKSP